MSRKDRTGRPRQKGGIEVISHRTNMGNAPENTLAGIRQAKRDGCDTVEFDVRLTADDQPVLFHDATLDRTTDATGYLRKKSFAQLAGINAGSEQRPESIPSLAEALDLCAGLGLRPQIEIKTTKRLARDTAFAVVRTLQDQWDATLPRPLISSFEPKALATITSLAPVEYDRALLLRSLDDDWQKQARKLDVIAIHADAEALTPAAVAAVKTAGYELRAYTVNDPSVGRALTELGIDGVFSDKPKEMRAALGAKPKTALAPQPEKRPPVNP